MSRLPSPQADPALAAAPGPHADPGTPARPKENDVTLLDSRLAAAPALPSPGPAPADSAAASAARAADGTRHPHARLESLFDPGSLSLLTQEDTSGVLTGTGRIDGMPAVSFASDPRVQGGAMGWCSAPPRAAPPTARPSPTW